MQAVKEISFGKFRLDLANQCLWQSGRAISLRPKAFAVLKLLIDNPGILVTKQQVLDAVWPNTFVGDAVLKDIIRQLREALNDDAASPAYIETSHRRGYRFIAKLSATQAKEEPAAPAPTAVPALLVTSTPPTLLGRETELAKMAGLLNSARGGDRQVLFVTGEPGIGKTTLVQAFLSQVADATNLRVVRGQCLEHYGAGEAYLPLLDGFSRLCRSSEGQPVLSALREHAPSWLLQMPTLLPQPERESLLSRSGGATRERMLREMADAIEHISSEFPLIIALEDLHWCDYSTLECLSYLAQRRDPARLLLIGTYRPVDVVLTNHPIKGVKRELQAHGLCHEIALEYLGEEAVSQYLLDRFPANQFPARLRRVIHQRTEGNPLFMVNLVQYLVDQNLIAPERDSWKLRVDLSQVEHGVPANIRQLIETQIERLSPDERVVLEGASIAGMECSSVAIAAGLDKPLDWVEHHCEELARRHQFLTPSWLVELPDGTITPRHRFIHVLYREVPYRLMAPMRRSQVHHRIAERGIAIFGDRTSEIAAELAMHFEQSRDWSRALEYITQAAENAVARSAHHEAIDLANRGLEALRWLPDPAQHARQEMKLRMILVVSLTAMKGFASPEVEQINAEGRELFWRHGPSQELYYMLWSLNMYHQFSGDMHSSMKVSSQLMQLAEELKDGALIMEAHRTFGATLNMVGRYSEALDHLEKGKALSAVHPDRHNNLFTNFDSRAMFDCFAAFALLPIGFPEQANLRLNAGLATARRLQHPQTLVVALHIAAQTHQIRRDPSLVAIYAREALKLAEEYGLSLWIAHGLVELGWAEAELGDAPVGIARIRRGLAEYEVTNTKLRTPYFMGLLADQLGKSGFLEEGLTTIRRAMALAGQTGESYALPDLHRLEGELLLKGVGSSNSAGSGVQSTAVAEARSSFEMALKIAREQGARWWELRAALGIDRLQTFVGEPNHTQLAEAYARFTEGFATVDLTTARAQLGLSPE